MFVLFFMLVESGKVVSYGNYEGSMTILNGRIGIREFNNNFDNGLFVMYIRYRSSLNGIIKDICRDLHGFYAFYYDYKTKRLYLLTSTLNRPSLSEMSFRQIANSEIFLADQPCICSNLIFLYHILENECKSVIVVL